MLFYNRGGIMLKNGLYVGLIALLVVSVASLEGCRRHGGEHKAEFVIDYVSEVLDLNDAQVEQLNRIKAELVEKGRQMHADQDEVRAEIIAQLKSEEIDQQRLKQLVAVKRAQMEELTDLMIVRLAEFYRTLSPEQKTRLVAKLETFKKWHDHDWE
jgi:Spy/CpxP family protein refolding chaperone